jgi:hypothetical protein
MNELPKSLKNWNSYNLLATYDHTKDIKLKSLIAKEIIERSAFNYLGWL